MTPKKMAQELVYRFSTVELQERNEGIDCALIAVDEIINDLKYIHTYFADMNKNLNLKFWQEVKQEIENGL